MRVWWIVVLLSLAVEAVTPAPSRITSFTLDPHGGIVVAAAFNGSGPYRLLLDTGANHSSISEEVARAVGAPPIARGVVSSPAGDREYLIVRVDRLAVGPVAVGGTPTAVPARDLAAAGAIDGVLGQDVLAGLRYTIDYRQRHIVWRNRASRMLWYYSIVMARATFSLDEATISEIRRLAERVRKPQSQVIREAVADYAERADRLSERERRHLLGVLDGLRIAKPTRSAKQVDAELKQLRKDRRAGGRRHPSA
ncbi:MAG: aspartyl protease family protein [Vicinamibacterales bacterium]